MTTPPASKPGWVGLPASPPWSAANPSMKLKLLHLATGNLYGGVEHVLVTLANHRETAPDLEQGFACCFEGRLTRELRQGGAVVHPLGQVRLRRPWSILAARRRLAAVCRETCIRAVVVHSTWAQALLAPVIRRQTSARLFFWQHAIAEGTTLFERLARRVPPDEVICNSRTTEQSTGRLFRGVPTHVIYCPVSLPSDPDPARTRKVIRQELGLPEDAVVILQVSRMEPWKGHRNLLRALARMQVSVDWRCLLVGGAQKPDEVSYERELLAMVQELGLAGRVIFAGQRNDVARVLRAADVFCQANEAPEPFGVVFVEALFAGLPVITSAFGGGAEIVDDTVGFLVAPADLARLAEALGRLVEDPALRTNLGGRGPARADTLCNPGRQLGSFRNLVVQSAERTSRPGASGCAQFVAPGGT